MPGSKMAQVVTTSARLKTAQKPMKVTSPTGIGDASFKKTNTVRKSTGNLAAHFASTLNTPNGATMTSTSKSVYDLERIETEYIKNLQQQVYFLELEANYLRDEARKATELQPQMKAEAQQMVTRLAELQSDLERAQTELKRKAAELDAANIDKERVLGKLKAAEDSHQREKRLLHDEIVQLKKEKELLDRSIANKDAEIIDIHKQLETNNSTARTADNKIRLLETQLSQKSEQLHLLQQTLDDKRSELLRTETKLRETEEKYYSSAATVHDKVKDDLREEIRMLKQKLKETELNAGQDRYIRTKLNDDNAHLVQENAYLSEKVLEMQKQLERERNLRESTDSRRSQSFTEIASLKDQENHLRSELDHTKELLKAEEQKVRHYIDQLSHLEQSTTGHQLSLTTARSRIAELMALHQSKEAEVKQLQQDNDLLSDRISELQKQLEDRETTVDMLRSRLRQLEPLEELQSTLHSHRWEEISRLAESMKTYARRTHASSASSPQATLAQQQTVAHSGSMSWSSGGRTVQPEYTS